jgi:L-lactate utilization protein LutC
MVFARSADEKLAKLLKKIEEEVEEHQEEKLSSFVNMIGSDAESLKKATAEFAAKHGLKRIAFVVPDDAKDGPAELKIAPDADVTVVCYKGGKVQANHAFAKNGLSDEKIDAVVKASCKLVD